MIFRILLRVLLLGMALVFFVSLLTAALVVLAVWLGRAAWAKAMGQPVAPWHFRFDPKARWRGFQGATGPVRASARRAASRSVGDISDVVAKDIKPDGAAQH